MVPSVFALIVLTAGLVLVYFGVKDLETELGTITLTQTPNVIHSTSASGPTGGPTIG